MSPLSHASGKAGGPKRSPETIAQDARSATKDRVIRVFVSSTFKDMVEDRNELMAQVWPALRKLSRGRAVEFVDVDLRWGVTEEQSQRKETLRYCLAEIKRCRPYFIGLLGERYGWTPGPEAFSPALLEEEGWLKNEVAKHSVTELEILHGVLNDPEMAGRAFFYFRDPKYAQARGGAYLPEEPARPTRQDVLKQRIRAVCQAKNIPLRENYADPRALAALVLADLTAAIDAEFPPDQVPDVWSREDRDHEAYARSRRTEFYVGRGAYFARLDAFARDGAKGCGLTVLGESGGGKSALLANWVARRRQAHPDDFIFQHYIGSSAMSAGHLALMRRLMVSIVRWCGADDPAGARGLEEEERKIPANADEIVKVFPDYLSRLAFRVKQKSVRGVIVLDALNQLEDRKRGRLLAWLLYRLPGELRLIVSTLPGDTLTALQPRGWPALTVEPLTPDECVHLIARYLAHFSQGLSEARARKIAASPASSNPLYIKTLLDDLRATGENRRIDQQIDDYLQAADIPALFGKILTRFERDYERDRPGLVREALSLLWAARRGLTETELLAALRSAGQERLPAAIWSPVRCALEDGLLDRDGVLAFAHEHLRTAVERRYVSEAGAGRSLRLRLADDFAGRPVDARQADELPWLLRQAESRDRLRACLLDIDRFLLMQKRDENEILGYWVWLKEERAMGQPYVQAFERWSGGKGETADVTYAASQVAGFLSFRGALYADAEPLLRQALAACVRMLGSNHPITLMTVNRLAVLLEKRGAYTAAQPLYERALAIREQVWGPEHPNTLTSLNNLAGLREIKSDYAAAQPLYERALTASERVLGPEHPDTIRCVSNLACLLMVNGDYVTALPLFERALAVSERVLGPEHSDTMTRVSNLAGLLARKGDYASARSLYERALTTSEQVLGPEHPLVATSLSNLAGLLQATNHPAEAEPLMRRALLINEQCYGPCHPDFAKMLNNLAHLLKTTGRSEEAEPLMRRALEIDQATYGPRHPDVALRLNNLAALLLATGRTTEAEHLARESLAMYEGIYAEGHPTVALALNTLAELLRGNGRFSEAEPLYRRALSIDERSVGPAHPDVAADLNNLALLLCATKRVPEAEPLLRRALDIDERCYGPDHPDVAGDLHTLASLLWDGNRLAEAEPLMRRGLEIYLQFTATNGREHPRLRLTLNNYVNLLRTRGDPQERVSACVCALAAKFGVTVCGS